MTLSEFILANMEAILEEWESFARTIPATAGMDRKALRDDAEKMLRAIARDMDSPQSREAQEAKSRGLGTRVWQGMATAAEDHGSARLLEGFGMPQLVSEYRAIRASVIRLWSRQAPHAETGSIYELTRFNEAIDQSLAESTVRYTAEVDRARELFLAVLGHDLRNPLGAIVLSANSLMMSDGLSSANARNVATILSGGARIQGIVADLLDVARIRLGGSLSVALKPIDLAATCRQAVAEAQTLHPNRTLDLRLAGDLHGRWDGARLAQLLSNLLLNAIEHGARDQPVTVSADAQGDEVVLRVHNEGDPIPEATLLRIFEPLVWTEAKAEVHTSASGLGLGLYIANAIAEAHRGSIDVESSTAKGTTFTVSLPRNTVGKT